MDLVQFVQSNTAILQQELLGYKALLVLEQYLDLQSVVSLEALVAIPFLLLTSMETLLLDGDLNEEVGRYKW